MLFSEKMTWLLSSVSRGEGGWCFEPPIHIPMLRLYVNLKKNIHYIGSIMS